MKIKQMWQKMTKSKGFNAFTASLLAIVLGLIFGFIVMLIAEPSYVGSGFTKMLLGGFGRIGDVMFYATPILMTGLAVGFAFKMGLFNIGASGQYTMGLFFALYVGLAMDLPPSIHWLVAVLAGLLGGMIWGIIPGLLKAYLNVNEVITSIMTNYIGLYLVDMLIQSNSKLYVPSMTRTAYIPKKAQLLSLREIATKFDGWFNTSLFTKIASSLGIMVSNVSIAFIFAVIIAIVLYIVLYKTTFGYELIATGYNKHASHYAGMNAKRNTVLTMMIAGGLAGLGGAFYILSPSLISGSSMTYEPINIIAAAGFNGIAVALLGTSSPLGIIFSALFISHIQRGGTLATTYGYKPEIIDIVIAVIIYFSAFALLMNNVLGAYLKKENNIFKKMFKRNKTKEEA